MAEGNDKMSVTSGRRLISTSPGSSDNVDYAQTRYLNLMCLSSDIQQKRNHLLTKENAYNSVIPFLSL